MVPISWPYNRVKCHIYFNIHRSNKIIVNLNVQLYIARVVYLHFDWRYLYVTLYIPRLYIYLILNQRTLDQFIGTRFTSDRRSIRDYTTPPLQLSLSLYISIQQCKITCNNQPVFSSRRRLSHLPTQTHSRSRVCVYTTYTSAHLYSRAAIGTREGKPAALSRNCRP